MGIWFELLVWAMLLPVLVPITTLCIECIIALLPRRRNRSGATSFTGRLAVVVPAHNEEDVLRVSLESIGRQLAGEDQLVVVADNCTDRTASIARQFGVEVIERNDAGRRGKGFAMDFARRHLASSPPDVVVFVDADCVVDDGALRLLASKAIAAQRPVQAAYIMASPQDASSMSRIAAFAFTVKNLVRPLGLSRLGGPCLLSGSGMAFPWQALETVSFGDDAIGEDYILAAELAIRGRPPIFLPDAQVTSCLPRNTKAATTQRQRWVHSHLKILLQYAPRLFAKGVMSARMDSIVLSAELSVPPLSLAILLWIAMMVLTSLAVLVGASPFPALACGLVGVFIAISVAGAYVRFGQATIRLSDLFALPTYILSEVPIFTSFLFWRHATWVRTERDPIAQGESTRDAVS